MNQLNDEIETFWRRASELRRSLEASDALAIWEALDELDVMADMSLSPSIRSRAKAIVTSHGFKSPLSKDAG